MTGYFGVSMKAAAAALLLAACAPRAAAEDISVEEFMSRLPSLLETAPAPPEISEAEIMELEEDDYQTYIFVAGALARPPRPVYLGGDGRLALSRAGTRESVSVIYRNSDFTYNQAEADKVSRLLRCRDTGESVPVSLKLLEILDAVEDHFGGAALSVLSGYRAPKHNRHVPGAARRSLHMLGWAADIRVPGRAVREVAKFAAGLGAGGVGRYVEAAFVHLDSGRARTWTYKAARPAAARPAPAR